MGRASPTKTSLADALFTRVEGRVLGILFGQPDRSFQGSELIAMAGSGTGAVHRVLGRLVESGLVTVTPVGRQKHYRANRESPVFGELHGLVLKTVGLAAPLAAALAPFAKHVQVAFVYGSVAKGSDTAKSDIDLMVIGEGLEYPELYEALQKAEEVLGRPVSPNLITVKEWKRKLAAGSPFVAKVWAQPKLFVVGSENGLG